MLECDISCRVIKDISIPIYILIEQTGNSSFQHFPFQQSFVLSKRPTPTPYLFSVSLSLVVLIYFLDNK